MPKLAKQHWRADAYDVRSFEYQKITPINTDYSYTHSSSSYKKHSNSSYTGNQTYYSHLRNENRPRKRKKRNTLQALISFSLLCIMMFTVMPFAFNNITKTIFAPTPYKNVKTDLRKLAFPTQNYISNAWFMGEPSFRYQADKKDALMEPLKENVNMPVLKSELTDLIELYPTVKPAIYVWDYETGNYIDINGDKIYSTASIIKIPVLIDVFKSIEAGQFSLEDTIPLTEYFRTEGSGSLQFKAANSEYTIDKLAEIMITESDNSATNMLMTKVGSMTDVNQNIRDWGLKNTEVQTWLPDYKGNNHTTAKEMAQMLYNIDENDKFLSDASRNKMLNYMGHVHNNRLIQAGLGAGSVFLHKTGDIGTMLGDAGIVITPTGKKYIVVILANRPHNAVAGKDFIVKASEIIYNYMVK